MNDNEPEISGDSLAEDFITRCAQSWVSKGLPEAAFANAALVWGLRVASSNEGPEEVAAGLQRMADAIMEGVPCKPKHLI